MDSSVGITSSLAWKELVGAGQGLGFRKRIEESYLWVCYISPTNYWPQSALIIDFVHTTHCPEKLRACACYSVSGCLRFCSGCSCVWWFLGRVCPFAGHWTAGLSGAQAWFIHSSLLLQEEVFGGGIDPSPQMPNPNGSSCDIAGAGPSDRAAGLCRGGSKPLLLMPLPKSKMAV